MPFLETESQMVAVIFSSICMVAVAFLVDVEEAALIAVFMSTAASCIVLFSALTVMVFYKEPRRSLVNPVFAALWFVANCVAFYFLAGSYLLWITLGMAATLSVLLITLYAYGP